MSGRPKYSTLRVNIKNKKKHSLEDEQITF